MNFDRDDEAVAGRLTMIHGALMAILEELRGRKRRSVKRTRALAQRPASEQLEGYRPTELQIARARRALRR